MQIFKLSLIYFCLLFVFTFANKINIYANTPIYVAVHGGDGAGIWRLEDRNGNGDVADEGEMTQFVSGEDITDVAVDEKGILYAVDGTTRNVYRIEDVNGDGDASDRGELTIFRGENEVGTGLSGPLSIAVVNRFDPEKEDIVTLVYVMDLALQSTVRLQDRDNDNDAQGADEICIINESTRNAPLTANRMTTDELGRIIASNPNNRTVVRLDDRNNDCDIVAETPDPGDLNLQTRCPSAPCGPSIFDEFHIIMREDTSGLADINLIDPFGVDINSKGEYFVSEFRNREFRVIKLTDLDKNDDTLTPGEASFFYDGIQTIEGYDIVVDENDIIYVAEMTVDGRFIITRLEDRNSNGFIESDPAMGEFSLFAEFTGLGRPLGLAAQLPVKPLLDIVPNLEDFSPEKGPLLVVENGITAQLELIVVNKDTGEPAEGIKVGSQAITGCFALCPGSSSTNPDGSIIYDVTRTAFSPERDETLKFWVNGDEIIIPVVSSSCNPKPPIPEPGHDKVVFTSQHVELDASASVGDGLSYCWIQTDGPDVGLPECTEDVAVNPIISFTAPDFHTTLEFELHVRNLCDDFGDAGLTIEVVEEGTPIPTPTLTLTPTPSLMPTPTPTHTPEPEKRFTFNCEHSFSNGRYYDLERLSLNLGEEENCVLKLTDIEPDTVVEVSTKVKDGRRRSINISPSDSKTDANGEIKFTIKAVRPGVDWAAWAIRDENGNFTFDQNAYDIGLAWGLFVEVNR